MWTAPECGMEKLLNLFDEPKKFSVKIPVYLSLQLF